jgi:hypothetical protein
MEYILQALDIIKDDWTLLEIAYRQVALEQAKINIHIYQQAITLQSIRHGTTR